MSLKLTEIVIKQTIIHIIIETDMNRNGDQYNY